MFEAFKAAKWTVKLIVIAVIAALGFLAFNFVDDLFSAGEEKQAEISENQAEAAIESGQDAVNTVTEIHTREVERHETVRTITEEVNNAENFDDAHAAGANGLCIHFDVCPEDPVQ